MRWRPASRGPCLEGPVGDCGLLGEFILGSPLNRFDTTVRSWAQGDERVAAIHEDACLATRLRLLRRQIRSLTKPSN